MTRTNIRIAALAGTLALTACGDSARLSVADGQGPAPRLLAPVKTLFPTVNIAKATAWPAGVKPTAPAPYAVNAFADGLDHPRWMHVLANGDVLVAETNAPPKPEDKQGGIKAWIQKLVMKRAGAGVPSANRITLLRDADGDGVAETRTPYLNNLRSPFGMAVVGSTLYVANADSLVAYPFVPGATRIDAPPRLVTKLPAGRNHHWTKSLVASPDGSRLYIGVGSNSNVADHGMAEEFERAAVWEVDPATGRHRIFATGLRNPVGIAFNPVSGALWTAVNERDEIGSDLVPDYMTSVRDGGHYGWPWSYYGQTVDARVKPQNPAQVARALKPDYALGPHTASLGLTFGPGGAFIGQHGSWNRKPRSGYKVVFVPFAGGRPSGPPRDLLTGFLDGDKAMGRPVGVEFARDGQLLVADDVGNRIWRVSGFARPPKTALR